MENVKLGKMLENPKAVEPTTGNFDGLHNGQSAGQGPLTEAELGWLAGIWDGEGSITMFRHYEKGRENHFIPVICVVNTCHSIINHVVRLLDRAGIRLRVAIQHKADGKIAQSYQVMTSKHSIIKKFLMLLTPYLIGKRPQAELLARFVDARLAALAKASCNREAKYDIPGSRAIEAEIRQMNKKGPKPQRLNAEPPHVEHSVFDMWGKI